jgi:3-oxoadipate enol-lactonase
LIGHWRSTVVSGTVVVCGSLGSNRSMWEPQRPVFGEGDVVYVEYPGHGSPVEAISTVRDLAVRVLDRIGAEIFSFVGLSLGGAVGLQLALDAPNRLDRLVLASSSARFGEAEQWRERARTVRTKGLEAIVDPVLERWFTHEFGGREPYRNMFLAVDPEGYARCCDALSRWDVREKLDGIAAPTLVISAAEDPSTPPEHGELLAARIPGARFELLEHAAHLANVERPDEFNRLLEEYL